MKAKQYHWPLSITYAFLSFTNISLNNFQIVLTFGARETRRRKNNGLKFVLGISLARSGSIVEKTIVDRFNQFVCRINFRCFDFFLICAMLPHLLRAFPLLISRLSLKYCRLATLMALFVSYLFISLSRVTLSDILFLKHPPTR